MLIVFDAGIFASQGYTTPRQCLFLGKWFQKVWTSTTTGVSRRVWFSTLRTPLAMSRPTGDPYLERIEINHLL